MKRNYFPQDILGILRSSALFEGFSETELTGLLPLLQPSFKHFYKDNIVGEEGDPVDQIGFIARGRIVARKMTSGGRMHILTVHEPGDIFGFDAVFSSYKSSPLTFIAETDCVVLYISAQCFFDRDSEASVRIMFNANRILADKCVRLLYKTDVLSKQALRDRILAYFSILISKNHSTTLTPKMSREQFAQYLCVNRSALSRELSRMQKEGLIELRRNGQILIRYDVCAPAQKDSDNLPSVLSGTGRQ